MKVWTKSRSLYRADKGAETAAGTQPTPARKARELSSHAVCVPSAPSRALSGARHRSNTRMESAPGFRQLGSKPAERPAAGYTLLDILIAITTVSLLMGFAGPAMTSLVKNDRLAAQINTLVGHLAHARSTAVTRHQSIILCASDDQASCSSNDWADGWVVFVDANNDSDLTIADEILSEYQGLPNNISLSGSMGSKVIYDRRGFAINTFGSFALCDDRGAEHMKSVSIQRTGRVHRGGAASC